MGELTGILVINKPTTWTSHDVVAKVRRLAQQKRVGHAGTLDPMAEGVLPILLGRATRLTEYIHNGHKTYRAVVQLGTATETDDAEGETTATQEVPPLTETLLENAFQKFRGEILQTPPRYSALKVGGQRAYNVARRGGALELKERPVSIYALRLLYWSQNKLTVEAECSKGTYIRSLARDIAAELGTVGHLACLLRIRVGPFTLEKAFSMEDLQARGITDALLPASAAIPDAPTFHATEEQARLLCNGQQIDVSQLAADAIWVYDPANRLIGLAAGDGARLRPRIAL